MPEWPNASLLRGISDHQREQYSLATQSRIGILTGGPGTGKSTVMGALALLLEDAAFVAPTGRAGVRLEEAIREKGLDFPCSTIHRMLKPTRNGHDGDGWGFHFNRFNKMPFKYVICDESSMNDNYIFRCLIEACDKDTHLLLVGDPDQLPPVGKGKPFLDLIQSRQVPHGHFTETHRFAGRIADVCKAINQGRKWQDSEAINLDAEYPENLKHLELKRTADVIATIDVLVRERFAMRTTDVMRDVQVIVPRNEGGVLTVDELGKRLQDILNPNGQKMDGVPFRVGDKVVCLKNKDRWTARMCPVNGLTVNSDISDYVANGEIGYVQEIGKKGIVVHFEGHDGEGGRILTYFDKSAWKQLRLGYALTGHKCQGGQWKFVIPVVDDSDGARWVCSRSWWYTAFSRGKTMVVPVGRRSVIENDCRKVDLDQRRTHLVGKLLAGGV